MYWKQEKLKAPTFVQSLKQTSTLVQEKKFKIGDRVRISKYDLPFRIGY